MYHASTVQVCTVPYIWVYCKIKNHKLEKHITHDIKIKKSSEINVSLAKNNNNKNSNNLAKKKAEKKQ